MKLLYIANIRMPSERAHSVQIMKTCEAFVRAGVELTLVVPNRTTDIAEDPFEYYGVRTRFPIIRLQVADLVRFGMLGFLIEEATFAFSVQRYVRQDSWDVVYGRDERVLRKFVGATGSRVVWESHEGSWNFAAKALARAVSKLVVISGGLERIYLERGIPWEKIVVAHDGVDLDAFRDLPSPTAARGKLGLPEMPTAVYVGSFGGWKGTEIFFEAAAFMPNVQYVAVGGKPNELTTLSQRYPHVRFVGEQPYRDAALYHAAGDCVVIPNTARNPVSNFMTSPLKVFTAMASGRPIIASDIPSLRDILDETEVFFFAPDDPRALAAAIRSCVSHTADSKERAERARKKVEQYTWDARARRILNAIAV